MFKRLLHYVEVRTKITSLFTFIFTMVVIHDRHLDVRLFPLLVFFVSMLSFDLTTTAINNYIDAKGNGAPTGFSKRTSLLILFALLGFSILTGLYLVYLTDILVLFIGMFCFAVGIVYTFGPVPISRQPYGEIVSGVMYGYFIPFLMIHIGDPGYLMQVSLQDWQVHVNLDLQQLFSFLLTFLTPTLLTASIMLANNTCDVEKDMLVKRFTLPYYIGQKAAVTLMYGIYILIFCGIALAAALNYLPWTSLFTLLALPKVLQHVTAFKQVLIKPQSFPYIIKNFMLVMSLLIVTTLIGSLI